MISKRTVNECLEEYLKTKGFNDDIKEKIMDSLHDKVEKESTKKIKREKKERDKERKRQAKVSHGTSCPRLMNDMGDLIVEM